VSSGARAGAAREEMLAWVACIGAVTAEALAARERRSTASARGRLLAAERERLLVRGGPLRGRPCLYALTRRGLRTCGWEALAPIRLSAATAAHMIACAEVAVALERAYPEHRVTGEPELRLRERGHGAPLASATLAGRGAGARLHRPDLVLWPRRAALPVAVEVELSLKAPRRLAEICRAWARCHRVAGVLYVVAPHVADALARAIERAGAERRIAAVALASIPCAPNPGEQACAQLRPCLPGPGAPAPIARAITGDA
jgi:hypothetical protein